MDAIPDGPFVDDTSQSTVIVREYEEASMLVENRLALVGTVSASICIGLFIWGVRLVTEQQFRERPDPAFTPGLAKAITVEEVCSDRPSPEVSRETRSWVFDHYGIDRPKPEVYELDFLIPPQLGGLNDRKNLWPQPKEHLEWNAYIKDALEKRLQELVCNRTIPLEEAQAALTKDWIGAYQTYFSVRLPLTIHVHPQ